MSRWLAIAVVFVTIPSWSASPYARKYVCKTLKLAPTCYWTHGRLGFTNGTPALRLWKIGTKRILGIYSGPETYPGYSDLDNEHPELPANLDGRLNPFENRIYADFEVCPLVPEKASTMQAACIEAAKNIVVVGDSK